MKAAISVIIVNFKGEKYITDSLDSIFKEQGNYEVIVVDSASPDGSVKLLKKRYKNNKKFKLMELKKIGARQRAGIWAHRLQKGNICSFYAMTQS